MRVIMFRALLICLLPALLPALEINVTQIVRDVAQKAGAAAEYAFEGDLLLVEQQGTDRLVNLAQAKVKLAIGSGGKSLVWVDSPDKGEYLVVSNGQKTWAYVPKLKQYTEEESAAISADADSDRGVDETWARRVIPGLARLYSTAASAAQAGEAAVKFDGKKQKWPVVRVFSKNDPRTGTSMTELTLDPGTMRIARLVCANLAYPGGVKTVQRLTIDFHSFQMGETLPDSAFTFDPPKHAKLVDALPIPGQGGAFLLNQTAPDFELKSLDGDRVRLEDLRGKPVLLTFFASWCGPCRHELPDMVKLYQSFKDQGLQVIGVNDEGKGTARRFAEESGVPFTVLDDSGEKVHRAYRVWNIPVTFVIDSNGKVVRFLRGSHDYDSLRSALKSVGL